MCCAEMGLKVSLNGHNNAGCYFVSTPAAAAVGMKIRSKHQSILQEQKDEVEAVIAN